MKRNFYSLLASLFLVFNGFSQANLQVTEEMKQMSRGEQPAFIVDIPEGDYKTILKEWISFLEEGTKLKVEEASNELIIKGAVFKKITLDSLNVYSSIYKIDTNIRIVAFFELDSVFISDREGNEDQKEISASLKSALRDFAVEQYIEVYGQKLEVEMDLLNDLEKERSSLVNEIEKYQKKIRGNEENIRQSEDAIQIAESDLGHKNTEIQNKKAKIAPLKTQDPESHKIAKKELSLLEKDKKRIENTRGKEYKNIVKYKKDISEADRSINQLEEQVKDLETKIDDQRERINQFENEKSRIR